MKTGSGFLLLLASVNCLALEETFRPYQPGSVYNLNRFLPWKKGEPEIVAYPTGCSVNAPADLTLQILFPATGATFSDVFHAECVRHDLCYRHGYYTYLFTKDDCDDEFAAGLENRCIAQFSGNERSACRRVAGILILAARKFGHLSYHSDDYAIRDFGYYYEYLEGKVGQFALLWAMLDEKSGRAQALYQKKVNGNRPLPPRNATRRLLTDFFRKKISLDRLLIQLKGSRDGRFNAAQVRFRR